jgi:hypothetical protein
MVTVTSPSLVVSIVVVASGPNKGQVEISLRANPDVCAIGNNRADAWANFIRIAKSCGLKGDPKDYEIQ